jgi:hypothetical protein
MNNSLDSELTDVYIENLQLIDTNHILSDRNAELETLVASLNKQIKRGYLN